MDAYNDVYVDNNSTITASNASTTIGQKVIDAILKYYGRTNGRQASDNKIEYTTTNGNVSIKIEQEKGKNAKIFLNTRDVEEYAEIKIAGGNLDWNATPPMKVYDGIYAKVEGTTMYFSHEDKYGDKSLKYGDKTNLLELDYYDWDSIDNNNSINHKNITKVIIEDVISPIQTYDMFSGFESLSEIEGINNFNMVQNTSMSSMFCGCKLLTSLNLSGKRLGYK